MDQQQIPLVKTFEFTKIIGIENIRFGKYIIIDDFVLIYAKDPMDIGNHVHIASFVSISGGGSLSLGDFSGIASGCRIITGTDDFKNWGFGNPTVDNRFRNVKTAPISIGRFCIIGANSAILPGVTIGEGATVAAGSVVSKSLEPWGIYVGNRRIAERNREAVLKNHQDFISQDEALRIGSLFKSKS